MSKGIRTLERQPKIERADVKKNPSLDLPDLPHRYWVSLGNWDYIVDDYEKKIEPERTYERAVKTRDELQFMVERFLLEHGEHPNVKTDEFGWMSWVTQDLNKAKTIAKRAAAIVLENGFEPDEVEISTQPICPKCMEQARFRDEFCSHCGTALVPPRDISIERSSTGVYLPIQKKGE